MKTPNNIFFNFEELAKKLRRESKVLVIESIAGVGGDTLTRQLLSLLLMNKQKVFVSTSSKTRSQIVQEFVTFGLTEDILYRNLFVITPIPEKGPNIYEIELNRLFTLSNAVKSCIKICIAGSLEIINPLFLLEKKEVTQKLLLELIQAARLSNTSLLVPIDVGIWSSDSISFVESIADIVIELREAVNGFKIIRGVRFKKFDTEPPTPFFEYTISERGIIVGKLLE